MTSAPEYHGSLVAFEGSPGMISTQLRLLPTSHQILILPNIQNYIANHPEDAKFHPATFIRQVHEAALARSEAAMCFLKEATVDSKRLVFLNGGTPSAYALCVKTIAQRETKGDLSEAESLLRRMLRAGLGGLSESSGDLRPGDSSGPGSHGSGRKRSESQYQDPITRAMKAADALDEKTASLQPSTDLDLTIQPRPRPRSMSLPVYGYVDHFGDSSPFYVFGARANKETDDHEDSDEDSDDDDDVEGKAGPGKSFFIQSPKFEISCFYDDRDETDATDTFRTPPLPPPSPSCIGETYNRLSMHSALSQGDCQSTFSTENVVYGEAAVVRMSKSVRTSSIKKARSLDRIYTKGEQYRDQLQTDPQVNTWEEILQMGRRFSCVDAKREREETSPLSAKFSFYGSPKTVFVKRSRSTVMRPQKSDDLSRASYVDKGTDAEDVPPAEESHQQVLPFNEDLVIYFKDGCTDSLLERFIGSFRDGTYPQAPETAESGPTPRTPRRSISSTLRLSMQKTETNSPPSPRTRFDSIDSSLGDQEYDPFSYHKQPSWMSLRTVSTTTITAPTPPTPAHTPPPPTTPELKGTVQSEKIRCFETTNCYTAVAVQNSLRSILSGYFPSEESGFHQFGFHQLPELDAFWKPIFRETTSGPHEDSGRRVVDQIVAIGAQAGVRKEFLSAVSTKLEKLGTGPGGLSRTGRLDFRYLIANAMQAFTAQPLAKQTDNPFTNSYLLATLVVPHLETYLAAHSEVKLLLLEYPPEHLATVLAAQRLIGVDLMKVAQVIDADNSAGLPFTHIRGTPINPNDLPPPPAKSPMRNLPALPAHAADHLSMTQANFLLTSTASSAEIATFVSTMSRILNAVSPTYRVVPAADAASSRPASSPKPRSVTTPLSGATFSPFPRLTPSPQRRTPSSPLSPTHRRPRSPPSPTTSTPTPSLADTLHLPGSAAEGAGSAGRLTPESKAAAAGKSGSATPVEDEGVGLFELGDTSDEDEDPDEKRLMPIYMRRKRARKGSSHKALKFLGLA